MFSLSCAFEKLWARSADFDRKRGGHHNHVMNCTSTNLNSWAVNSKHGRYLLWALGVARGKERAFFGNRSQFLFFFSTENGRFSATGEWLYSSLKKYRLKDFESLIFRRSNFKEKNLLPQLIIQPISFNCARRLCRDSVEFWLIKLAAVLSRFT